MNAIRTPVNYRADVLTSQGRLVVVCAIDHFMHSGHTMQDLFAALRPRLVAAIENAAVRDPNPVALLHPLSVRIDVGCPDPGLEVWVYSPAAAVVDLSACLARIEAILTSLVAGHRIGGGQ